MIKRYLLLIVGLFIFQSIFAEIPDGYYDTAVGKEGYELKTALHVIIKTNHNTTSYTPGIWDAFETTEVRADGKVWDTYSTCDFTFVVDQDPGSGGTAECEYFNREHSFPRLWFGGTVEPMNTDLFHIMPTDKFVNNQRGNLEYGEVSSPTSTFSNGSKIGPNTYGSYSGTVFEPIDEYKGDFARNYFYMVTRYEDVISSWPGSAMLDGSNDQCFSEWALDMLIEWHTNDPVSEKELDRNDAIYEIQDNRNPFIDYPDFVDAIFGSGTNPTGISKNLEISNVKIFPNPAKEEINIELENGNSLQSIIVYNLIGEKVLDNDDVNGSFYTFKVNNLPKGVYFLQVDCLNNSFVQKIIIK
jgi:endonuclease I